MFTYKEVLYKGLNKKAAQEDDLRSAGNEYTGVLEAPSVLVDNTLLKAFNKIQPRFNAYQIPGKESFSSALKGAYGQAGVNWLNAFKQNVKKYPKAYSRIYTPQSISRFTKYFNPAFTVNTIKSPSRLLSINIAQPMLNRSDVVYAPKEDFRSFKKLRANLPGSKREDKIFIKPTLKASNSPYINTYYAYNPTDPTLNQQLKAHQFLHELAAHPVRQPNKVRLQLNRVAMRKDPTRLIDPYILQPWETAQANLGAGVGRNWLKEQLVKNPQSYKNLKPQNFKYITEQMPAFLDANDPERGKVQARDFYNRVKNDPALQQALPVQANRHYGNLKQLQDSKALLKDQLKKAINTEDEKEILEALQQIKKIQDDYQKYYLLSDTSKNKNSFV